MTIEQGVSSLEPSKRLKDLGVPQNSYWHHVVWPGSVPLADLAFNPWQEFVTKQVEWINTKGNRVTESVLPLCSAFTASELGEALPWEIGGRVLKIAKGSGGGWHVYYEENVLGCIISGKAPEDQSANKLADALALMRIHLLEKQLISV